MDIGHMAQNVCREISREISQDLRMRWCSDENMRPNSSSQETRPWKNGDFSALKTSVLLPQSLRHRRSLAEPRARSLSASPGKSRVLKEMSPFQKNIRPIKRSPNKTRENLFPSDFHTGKCTTAQRLYEIEIKREMGSYEEFEHKRQTQLKKQRKAEWSVDFAIGETRWQDKLLSGNSFHEEKPGKAAGFREVKQEVNEDLNVTPEMGDQIDLKLYFTPAAHLNMDDSFKTTIGSPSFLNRTKDSIFDQTLEANEQKLNSLINRLNRSTEKLVTSFGETAKVFEKREKLFNKVLSPKEKEWKSPRKGVQFIPFDSEYRQSLPASTKFEIHNNVKIEDSRPKYEPPVCSLLVKQIDTNTHLSNLEKNLQGLVEVVSKVEKMQKSENLAPVKSRDENGIRKRLLKILQDEMKVTDLALDHLLDRRFLKEAIEKAIKEMGSGSTSVWKTAIGQIHQWRMRLQQLARQCHQLTADVRNEKMTMQEFEGSLTNIRRELALIRMEAFQLPHEMTRTLPWNNAAYQNVINQSHQREDHSMNESQHENSRLRYAGRVDNAPSLEASIHDFEIKENASFFMNRSHSESMNSSRGPLRFSYQTQEVQSALRKELEEKRHLAESINRNISERTITSIQKQIEAHEDYIRESKPLLEMLVNRSEKLVRDIEVPKHTILEDKASQVSNRVSSVQKEETPVMWMSRVEDSQRSTASSRFSSHSIPSPNPISFSDRIPKLDLSSLNPNGHQNLHLNEEIPEAVTDLEGYSSSSEPTPRTSPIQAIETPKSKQFEDKQEVEDREFTPKSLLDVNTLEEMETHSPQAQIDEEPKTLLKVEEIEEISERESNKENLSIEEFFSETEDREQPDGELSIRKSFTGSSSTSTNLETPKIVEIKKIIEKEASFDLEVEKSLEKTLAPSPKKHELEPEFEATEEPKEDLEKSSIQSISSPSKKQDQEPIPSFSDEISQIASEFDEISMSQSFKQEDTTIFSEPEEISSRSPKRPETLESSLIASFKNEISLEEKTDIKDSLKEKEKLVANDGPTRRDLIEELLNSFTRMSTHGSPRGTRSPRLYETSLLSPRMKSPRGANAISSFTPPSSSPRSKIADSIGQQVVEQELKRALFGAHSTSMDESMDDILGIKGMIRNRDQKKPTNSPRLETLVDEEEPLSQTSKPVAEFDRIFDTPRKAFPSPPSSASSSSTQPDHSFIRTEKGAEAFVDRLAKKMSEKALNGGEISNSETLMILQDLETKMTIEEETRQFANLLCECGMGEARRVITLDKSITASSLAEVVKKALIQFMPLDPGVVYSTRKYMTGSNESKVSFPNGLANDEKRANMVVRQIVVEDDRRFREELEKAKEVGSEKLTEGLLNESTMAAMASLHGNIL